MFFDDVSDYERRKLGESFKNCYASKYSSNQRFPQGNINIKLFVDHNTEMARKGLLVTAPKMNRFHVRRITVGEISGYLMEAPEVRSGVPHFRGQSAYIEIASGRDPGEWCSEDPALSILEKTVTQFETPAHKRIFHDILAGKLKKYTNSALYDYLHKTGQAKKW